MIAGGSWDFTLSHLGQAALYELFGMLGALALGLLIMHSAAAIVTYFVLPTVVGIVVEVVSALHGPAEWFEPNRVDRRRSPTARSTAAAGRTSPSPSGSGFWCRWWPGCCGYAGTS